MKRGSYNGGGTVIRVHSSKPTPAQRRRVKATERDAERYRAEFAAYVLNSIATGVRPTSPPKSLEGDIEKHSSMEAWARLVVVQATQRNKKKRKR